MHFEECLLSKISSQSCAFRSPSLLAVRSEQIEKQPRLEIMLGDGRWPLLQNKLAQDGGESASHAFPNLTAGILWCVSSKMLGLSQQGVMAGQSPQPAQPASGIGPSSCLPGPGPDSVLWASQPALARVPVLAVKLQRQASPSGGVTAKHLTSVQRRLPPAASLCSQVFEMSLLLIFKELKGFSYANLKKKAK